jgi:hypothetical protein
MNEDRELLDVDARVRAALTPTADASRRIVARALANGGPPARHPWRATLAIVTVAAVVVTLAVVLFERRRSSPGSPARALTITSAGSTLVVESPDGRRWVIGRVAQRRGGNYTMVVTE